MSIQTVEDELNTSKQVFVLKKCRWKSKHQSISLGRVDHARTSNSIILNKEIIGNNKLKVLPAFIQ